MLCSIVSLSNVLNVRCAPAGPSIVTNHPIYISSTSDKRTIFQSDALPALMKRPLW